VAREERRKVRVRWLAAGCAAAVAVMATVVGVRVAAIAPVEHRFGQVFSPDRLPDPANLPSVEQVWPEAVHKLPKTLPDGSEYTVYEVLGEGRYLVGWGGIGRPNKAPGVFDTRAGTVTSLAPPGAIQGVAEGRVLSARMAGDRAVWILEGFRRNQGFRDLWTARLDGTGLRQLVQLRNGVPPRFAVSGQTVLWDQEIPGSTAALKAPFTTVWRVSVSGGPAAEIPGSRGWSLADDGPWLTTQVIRDGIASHDSGHVWNPVTGQKLRWKAERDVQFLRCGPAWCTGAGKNGGIGLQRLDGTGYVELPYSGQLSSARGGRFALDRDAPLNQDMKLVWDRQTGRAAAVPEDDPSTPRLTGETMAAYFNGDQDKPVAIWRTAEHLMLLDLYAID
jgi:hypothetical protein